MPHLEYVDAPIVDDSDAHQSVRRSAPPPPAGPWASPSASPRSPIQLALSPNRSAASLRPPSRTPPPPPPRSGQSVRAPRSPRLPRPPRSPRPQFDVYSAYASYYGCSLSAVRRRETRRSFAHGPQLRRHIGPRAQRTPLRDSMVWSSASLRTTGATGRAVARSSQKAADAPRAASAASRELTGRIRTMTD